MMLDVTVLDCYSTFLFFSLYSVLNCTTSLSFKATTYPSAQYCNSDSVL